MKRPHLFPLVAIYVILFSAQLFAVSEASVLSLLLSPSPQANAMGQSYGTLWADDPMSSAINPASIGLFAQNKFTVYSFYPEKTSWLPAFANDLWYNAKAFNVGFNFLSVSNIPVSIGIGHFDANLNLGEQIYTDETGEELGRFTSYEKHSSAVFSAAVDYYFNVSFGYAAKNIDSNLGGGIRLGSDPIEARAQLSAHDWGLIIQAPLFDILEKIKKPVTIGKLHPFLTP